jgi:BirA family transcriptional regulator, biotin operon repressor / biotin---[acetyl-CoA-carboxylase] ligase
MPRPFARTSDAMCASTSRTSKSPGRFPRPTPGSSSALIPPPARARFVSPSTSRPAEAGAGLCFSLSWTFREVPADFGSLSLCLGVCALRVLKSLGVAGVALKWPNDLLSGDRKLGGVLIELRAEVAGPACVIVGIGINVALGPQVLQKIAEAGTAATDLVSAGLAAPKRNALTGALTTACVRGLRQYEREGLKPFISEWRAADALRGRPVNVSTVTGTVQGLARGIDLHGALLLDTPEGVKRFISGDVTVRAE